MKLKDLLKEFEGLDPETEILLAFPIDFYRCYLNSTMEVNTICIDMSNNFIGRTCKKVLFLA